MRARDLVPSLLLLIVALAAGCAGGSNATVPASGNATLQIGESIGSASHAAGADVYVAPGDVPAQRALIGSFDVRSGSPRCTNRSDGSRRCTLTMPVPAGHDIISVEHWDTTATGASSTARSVERVGHRLGTASFTTTVSANTTVSMGVASEDATPAALSIAVSPTALPAAGGSIVVSVTAYDGATPANAIAKDFSVAIFAPPGAIKAVGTAPPTATPIFAPDGVEELSAGSATYTYVGGATNPITAVAIAGTFSESAQIVPAPAPTCGNASTVTYTNPQTNSPGTGSALFHLKVGIGSGTLSSEVDTGSTGVQFPVKNIPANSSLVVGPGKAFSIPLQPSGNVQSGNVYLARLTLQDTNGNAIGTTIPIEIEGLSQSCVGTTNCTSTNLFPYVGIGFDREADSTTWSSLPVVNPVLQLTNVVTAAAGSAMHPGYILNSTSMMLGLTSTNTAAFSAAGYDQLTPNPAAAGDWNGATGCIAFSGGTPVCGSMLLDVGQSDMFVTNIAHPSPASIASVAITAPTTTNALLSYSFAYPTSGTAPAPNAVIFSDLGGNPFVNLGAHAIASKQYLYDAACGLVGYAAYQGT